MIWSFHCPPRLLELMRVGQHWLCKKMEHQVKSKSVNPSKVHDHQTHPACCNLSSFHLIDALHSGTRARTSIVESPRSSVHCPGARRSSLQRDSRAVAITVICGLLLALAAQKRCTIRQTLRRRLILGRHTYVIYQFTEFRSESHHDLRRKRESIQSQERMTSEKVSECRSWPSSLRRISSVASTPCS